MSIVDEGSVLILGAGSSHDFGLPLGADLIEKIEKATLARAMRTNNWGERYEGPTYWGEDVLKPSKALGNPIGAAFVGEFFRGNANYNPADLEQVRLAARKLGVVLSEQTSETIDDFISLNSLFAEPAKICIAAIFAGSLFDAAPHDSGFVAKALHARQSPDGKNRNWIHLLINIARHHYRGQPPKHPIKIISFNYDGILETVLKKQFKNVEESFGEPDEYFEIVHPHGFCGMIPDAVSRISDVTSDWARKIWVVNEPVGKLTPEVIAARSRAKEMVRNAKHIYAAGFSFSHPNCELLGLYEKPSPFSITYHNFANDIGMDLAVGRVVDSWPALHKKSKEKWVQKGAGSDGRSLSIANWIRAGYLGVMPG